MGKASASKKIKRVQAAGVSRSPGQRRNLGFPVLVIGIVLVGSVLTFFARDFRQGESADAPAANQDHWHAAFAVKLCGAFEKNPATPDTADGIHVHSDGLIHIHPYVDSAAGKNATFGLFAKDADIKLGDGEFTLPDGQTFKDGDDCTDDKGKKEKGRVALYVWPPQATDKTKPEVITKDLGDVRFEQEGMSFVLAFGPDGEDAKLPPSTERLKNPNDSDEEPAGGDEAPGGADSTVPGDITETPVSTETTAPTEATAPTETTAKPGG